MRRRDFFGLFGATALVGVQPEAQATVLPQAKFLRGQVMPRTVYHAISDPGHSHGFAAAVVIEYDIFDGEKFVPLNSDVGQAIVKSMS